MILPRLAAVTRSPARSLSRLLVPGLIAGGVVVADQATKLAVADWLGRGEPSHRWEMAGALLAVEYVENTGAAFGSFQGQGQILVLVALAVVAGLMLYYLHLDRVSAALAGCLGLLWGGAVGNLIDRVRLGYVVDFIAVGIWPKFNVADVAVAGGVILLAWHVLIAERRPASPDAPHGGA